MAVDRSVFDRRIEPHDANQLELKLAYVIRPGARRERYSVEAHMFVPRTLGINRYSYRPEHFYADTSAFLRLETPVVPLADLASEERAGEGANQHDSAGGLGISKAYLCDMSAAVAPSARRRRRNLPVASAMVPRSSFSSPCRRCSTRPSCHFV